MHYNELIETLQQLINRQVTQKELSAILCITAPTTMSGRASRNSKFSTDEIRKIENYFNVNILSQNNQLKININDITLYYYTEPELIYNSNKYELSGQKEAVHISKSLIESFSSEKKYIIIKAYGDSMNPDIKNGDRLIIELADKYGGC